MMVSVLASDHHSSRSKRLTVHAAHITANDAIQDKDIDPIMEKVANRYMEQLSTLYSYGAKNFLLLNVPRSSIPSIPILVPFPLTHPKHSTAPLKS